MLAVGWGEYNTTKNRKNTTHNYVIVKNSFGAGWGLNGYANI
jgi:C1A family cysteine protease